MSSRSFNNVISEIMHSSFQLTLTTFNISGFIRIMNRYWTYHWGINNFAIFCIIRKYPLDETVNFADK